MRRASRWCRDALCDAGEMDIALLRRCPSRRQGGVRIGEDEASVSQIKRCAKR